MNDPQPEVNMNDLNKPNNNALDQPLVSVIIPCYNVQQYVSDALNSVVAQTYSNLEIICVDDGSSDNTVSVLESWKVSHPVIATTIIKQENRGACVARNNGLRRAAGKFIQFLDADDVLYPEKIRHQVGLFLNTPGFHFIAGAYCKRSITGDKENITCGPPALVNIFIGRAGITSSNLFNRGALLAIDGWREELSSSQEADLMFRLVLNGGKYMVDNDILTEIRERSSGQISQGNQEKRFRNFLFVRIELMEAVEKIFPEEWRTNRNLYQSFIVSTLLGAESFKPGMWRLYCNVFPKPSELVPIAGLGKKAVVIARLLGFSALFKIGSAISRMQN